MHQKVIEQDQTVIDFADKQLKILWFWNEPKVEKDVQDIMVNMTEAERHGITTTLKLFTLYELKAGKEYWLGKYMKIFKEPEHQRMASVFGMFELAVHKPFYQEINKLLYLHTDEFYNSYVEDPVLKERMEFIDEVISSKNDLYSLGVFSMVEGAILYTAFGYIKHFQSKGKNKALNIVRGANFSVRDENLHSIAGAYSFKKKLSQKNLSEEELAELKATIYTAARKIYEHECRIAEMIFEKGSITGITQNQLENFAMSRINQCLHELGYVEPLEKVTYNPIADWFYDGINGFQYNDFFSGLGNSYHRDWDENAFIWKKLEEEQE